VHDQLVRVVVLETVAYERFVMILAIMPEEASEPEGRAARELCKLAGIKPRTNIETGAEEPWKLKDLHKTYATYYDEHLPESSIEMLGAFRWRDYVSVLCASRPLGVQGDNDDPAANRVLGARHAGRWRVSVLPKAFRRSLTNASVAHSGPPNRGIERAFGQLSRIAAAVCRRAPPGPPPARALPMLTNCGPQSKPTATVNRSTVRRSGAGS
jgi:hypothetical protein